MAPESILNKTYSTFSDVYSLGITFSEILNDGEPPYGNEPAITVTNKAKYVQLSNNSKYVQLSNKSKYLQLSNNSKYIQLSNKSKYIQLSNNSKYIQ